MSRSYQIIFTDGTRLELERVFGQYFKALVLFAAHYFPQQEECESLVQEAFVALWENRLEFPNELALRAYLYSIVRNKALNLLKHQKVEQTYINRILEEKEAEFYHMKSVIQEEVRRLVMEAVDSLPEQSRKVCLLNLEGLNNQEIAEQLGISLNTVKFHKKNAYQMLREQLKEHFCLLFFFYS